MLLSLLVHLLCVLALLGCKPILVSLTPCILKIIKFALFFISLVDHFLLLCLPLSDASLLLFFSALLFLPARVSNLFLTSLLLCTSFLFLLFFIDTFEVSLTLANLRVQSLHAFTLGLLSLISLLLRNLFSLASFLFLLVLLSLLSSSLCITSIVLVRSRSLLISLLCSLVIWHINLLVLLSIFLTSYVFGGVLLTNVYFTGGWWSLLFLWLDLL